MKQAAACFAKEFTYDDGQFLGSIQNDKSQLAARFELGKSLLPPNSVLVIDSLAVCPSTGKIGTRLHVEDENQRTLPRTRGCSFYTVDASSGLLRTGFRVSEMIVKPSKDMANGLVSSASKILESSSPSSPASETPQSSPPASVIEAYFRAWNARDMDAALDCFVDDCVYETEDPVFVDKFEGKESLRKHLETNAKALPPACQIVLDDLAIDPLRGTAGVKWHLEAGGVPIPNLRGCSMYTMDSNNNSAGLLQSGFDVTEAPVKLPGVVGQTLLATTRVLPQTLFRTFWGVQ